MASELSIALKQIRLSEPEEVVTHEDDNRAYRRAIAKRHKITMRRGENVPYRKADDVG